MNPGKAGAGPAESDAASRHSPTGDEHQPIAALCARIEDADVAAALMANAGSLPLRRDDVVMKWLDAGLAQTAGNKAAGVAWVSLESSRSRALLAELEGRVAFSEHSRIFELLAEALAAGRVNVECTAERMDFRPAASCLPAGDGRVVTLPGVVNLFDNRADNFGFYKISLFHQLGYVEFGCFSGIGRVNRVLGEFGHRPLAERIFQIVEDARVDWQLCVKYPGLRGQMATQKAKALAMRVKSPGAAKAASPAVQLLEVLTHISLDGKAESQLAPENRRAAMLLRRWLVALKRDGATLDDSLAVTRSCYGLIAADDDLGLARLRAPEALPTGPEALPGPVTYRGEMDVAAIASAIDAPAPRCPGEPAPAPDPQAGAQAPVGNPDDLEPGQVDAGVALLLSGPARILQGRPAAPAGEGRPALTSGLSAGTPARGRYVYDEWDYRIADYRTGWCTLYEHREPDTDEDCTARTLATHRVLAGRIRRELDRLRPQRLHKVRGMAEGEEPDLERAIAGLVDRRAGLTPDDRVYVQRRRRDRDVSTLFLLDMSASTDAVIPDPEARPEPPLSDDDEAPGLFFRRQKAFEAAARRIIDVEKESVILMAQALEQLGDAWSVCGFSGYGREQVDYYLCKDFDEPFDRRAKGRIGGMKPCRSTRMGPAVRHAARRLLATGARVRALIIISDGYPQDHDYGPDRSSRTYGLLDTMQALSEARRQGVLTFCLTVDPAGHDYLRAMCPESQYMVIQDPGQLPQELSRVYRSLTG